MGNLVNKGKQAANQITNSEAWKKYTEDLKQWEETCKAMEEWELDKQKRLENPNCCCLSIYWCQMIGSLCELPCRISHHFCCFGLTYPCSLACGENSLWWLHAQAHSAISRIYTWLFGLLISNLSNPCHPEYYAYWDDVSLERPPKPQPPVGYDAEKQAVQGPEKSANCCSCGDCCSCDCCKLFQHTNRLFRAAFCSLSCYHSCHPALICGPLCTEPGCCVCCEGWESRKNRWDREATEAKERRTREFYDKTGRVRVPSATADSSHANTMGKPGQMAMV